MSTIVALSSGRPPSAIGVVRMSGPAAFAAAEALVGSLPANRRAGLRLLRGPAGEVLDRALVLAFAGPATATGEDLVEFHCHGGRAVVEAVLSALTGRPGCRSAEPGEFTRRALANGRIDLAEAEGLADLLEAETELQRVAALAAAEGRVSRQVTTWMDAVAVLSARIEVAIDYDDEEDGRGDRSIVAAVAADAARLGREIAVAAEAVPVERLRDGVRVVIAGPPNAGKSTLLNLLSERDAAIVSPIAGTTRDLVEAPVRRGEHGFVLIDTAGLTETDDQIEAIGIERARYAAERADLLLWLGDGPPPVASAIRIHARADLAERVRIPEGATAVRRDDPASIDRLWQMLMMRAGALVPRADAIPWRERHRRLCASAARSLCCGRRDPLLLAEDLRHARRSLAQILGVDATAAMLDAMFARFCLGK